MRVSVDTSGCVHALLQQVGRLRHVRVVLGPGVEGQVEERSAELASVLRLPRLDRRDSDLRAGRDVVTVVVEPAMASHATRDQRLGEVVALEELRLGVLELVRPPLVRHSANCILRRIQTATGSSRKLLTRIERQESILRGAAAAFAHTGFDGTSMEDVADASGITRLIVYRNFASKEDLYRSVLERVAVRLGEEFLGATSAVQPLLTVAREDPDAFRLLWVHAAHEPQFAAYAADFREKAIAVADEVVGSLIADARVRRWAMITIVDHLYDAVLTWLDVGDQSRDDEFVAVTSSGLRALVRAWGGHR